jgi:hypothetical protein
MHSFPPDATQSWFVVKAAVELSPIFVFLTADAIASFLRSTLWRCAEVVHRSESEPPQDEPAGAAARRGRRTGC